MLITPISSHSFLQHGCKNTDTSSVKEINRSISTSVCACPLFFNEAVSSRASRCQDCPVRPSVQEFQTGHPNDYRSALWAPLSKLYRRVSEVPTLVQFKPIRSPGFYLLWEDICCLPRCFFPGTQLPASPMESPQTRVCNLIGWCKVEKRAAAAAAVGRRDRIWPPQANF